MAERKMTKEKMRMSRRAIGSLLAALAAASPTIASFEVGSSDTESGAHPDLSTKIVLSNPGQPEVVKDVAMNLPTGVFGNPGAISKCRSADFAVNHCTPGSQVGKVTIVANYEGNPTNTLGTVPVYNMETVSVDEAARMA